MAPFEALYGRNCTSPLFWDDLSEALVIGPDMIRDMSDNVKLIQSRMKTAQDKHAKYSNVRRRPLSFEQDDRVFLKISPFRGYGSIRKERKYQPDASHVLQPDEAKLDETLRYFERLVQILDRKDKQLRNKSIQLVKVKWSRHGVEEATWELEHDMRQRYPELFV
ncbi:uncharacterized protein [Henckelia pumila]|uniref:uncharacterized protein n=1 Tax=Henckelia pumila TaxID=405737 RepID=UPI003C6DE8CA